MQDWKIVRDFNPNMPELLDVISSPNTVYERKNIKEIAETTDAMENIVAKHWEYEQREWTTAEWADIVSNTNSPVTQFLMQQISSMQMDKELSDITAQEERQLIAQNQSNLELAIAQLEVKTV